MLERVTAKIYEYPPTEKEAQRAMQKQALISFRFHTDPTMTVQEYATELETALAPIKETRRTENYTLDELAQLASAPENKRLRKIYEHERNHALQICGVIRAMGIAVVPEFVVYYCPIMADMYQCGNGIGLIETNGITGLSREQLIEFETRLAFQMLGTTQNSIGDLYIIGAMILAKVVSFVKTNSDQNGVM